jgi:type III secretion system FlhB-like substrate exporter
MKKTIFFLFAASLVACGETTVTENVIEPENNITIPIPDDPNLRQKVDAIENIFYSIPSPRETIEIIEDAGAVFDVQLTNDPSKLDSYTSKTERALNMGVYGADVNYCTAFNKTSDVMMLLACTRTLGDQLGLASVFNQNVQDRLNDNRDDADSVQSIITATFWEIESKLQDDGRPELAALIVIGGWIEGLYIACGQAKINMENQAMIDQIAGQQVALNHIIGLAGQYQETSENATNEKIKDLLISLEELRGLYDKIEVTESAGSGGETDGIPTIGKKIERNMSAELLQEITVMVFKMRDGIVG